MYCTKCGKKVNAGDRFCGQCGNVLILNSEKKTPVEGTPKRKKYWWLVVLAVLAGISFITGTKADKKTSELQYAEVTVQTPFNTTTVSPKITPEVVEQKVAELGQSDGLDSVPVFWEGGKTRRMVDRYPLQNPETVEIWDYLEDGTLIRYAEVHYSDTGEYQYKTVTTYDEYGNPTDVLETMEDGSVWLHYYYVNEYDTNGRPVTLLMYNRAGEIYNIDSFIYYPDGSYLKTASEYRGALYEYDFETNPEGKTTKYQSFIIEYDASGNEISFEQVYPDMQ